MPVQKVSKSEILFNAFVLFRGQGYHHTSMSDVAKSCDLFKGSLYHHFASKKDLMKELLKKGVVRTNEQLFSAAYRDDKSAKQNLQEMMKRLKSFLLEGTGGCFMGNMALETASTEPDFIPLLKMFFDNWKSAMTHIFLSKYKKREAEELAISSMQQIEGCLVLIRVYGDDKLFDKTIKQIVAILDVSDVYRH